MNLYTQYLTTQYGSVADAVAANPDIFQFTGELTQSLPYVGIAAGLADGHYGSAAVDAVSLIPGMQWVGVAYAVYNVVEGLLSSPPTPWGSAHFITNADGSVGIDASGDNGGKEMVANTLSGLEAALNQQVSAANLANPALPLGLVADRMPGLSYDGTTATFTLDLVDPVTGADTSTVFYSNGQPDGNRYLPGYNSADLQTQFLENALEKKGSVLTLIQTPQSMLV